MAVDDIYRVKIFQTYGTSGPEVLNVYYYKQLTPGSVDEGAEHLAGEWESALGPTIRAIQTTLIKWTSIEVENIIPSSDFFTQPYITTTGDIDADTLPPSNCWSFRLNRSTSASRNGQKRICGVAETSQDDGVAVGAFESALNVVGALFDDVIGGPPPADATYQPIIFRPGRAGFTIPEKVVPAVLQADFPIESSQYVRIGTQNSRKFA